jgi:cytochrome c-type biogenesis protein CcmF
MVVIATFSFGLVIWRLPLLKARNELDSWISREAAFLVNNWILLFSALFILFATMFPTLSEAVTGNRIAVAQPFFNKWMLPIGFILLFLTGVGPLLAWRKSAISNLRDSFLFPVVTGVVTAGVLAAFGFRVWVSGLCFAICAFVTGTIVQEFWRGANVRRRATGTDMFTALVGLVGRNKRRYGGYIVHVGIVLIFLGFAGNGYKRDQQLLLKPGETATIGAYTVRNDGIKLTDDGQKQMVTGYVAVFKGGKQIDTMYPGKSYFHKHENEPPRTDVAIRRTPAEDFYVIMPAVEPGTQTMSLEVHINPLVDWIWMGFGVLAFGTGIALLPESTFAFAVAKLPAEAATTTLSLLLAFVLFAGSGTRLSAQMGGDAAMQTSFYARTPQEVKLQHEIVCTCGCGHITIAECRKDPCPTSHELRGEVAGYLDQGKSHDEIISAVVAKHSEEVLGAPIDKGFNRLAWLFPYLVGATGAVLIAFTAMKWTRRGEPTPATAAPMDADLAERLDDELRNLD